MCSDYLLLLSPETTEKVKKADNFRRPYSRYTLSYVGNPYNKSKLWSYSSQNDEKRKYLSFRMATFTFQKILREPPCPFHANAWILNKNIPVWVACPETLNPETKVNAYHTHQRCKLRLLLQSSWIKTGCYSHGILQLKKEGTNWKIKFRFKKITH